MHVCDLVASGFLLHALSYTFVLACTVYTFVLAAAPNVRCYCVDNRTGHVGIAAVADLCCYSAATKCNPTGVFQGIPGGPAQRCQHQYSGLYPAAGNPAPGLIATLLHFAISSRWIRHEAAMMIGCFFGISTCTVLH